jgi:hypothetical protein
VSRTAPGSQHLAGDHAVLTVLDQRPRRCACKKDTALFPGPDDPREFWQRAEDRNRHTADLLNQIGLPEYCAVEAFVRWDGRQSKW